MWRLGRAFLTLIAGIALTTGTVRAAAADSVAALGAAINGTWVFAPDRIGAEEATYTRFDAGGTGLFVLRVKADTGTGELAAVGTFTWAVSRQTEQATPVLTLTYRNVVTRQDGGNFITNQSTQAVTASILRTGPSELVLQFTGRQPETQRKVITIPVEYLALIEEAALPSSAPAAD